MNGYFVTGTDTGVGKTFVTCELARLARLAGHRVFAFKPIETGCAPTALDQEALCHAAGDWQTGDLRGCYRFEVPAAPLVAATEPIELEHIRRTLARGAELASRVFVEGAGGWRVPITSKLDMAGLAIHCQLPVIVVARAGLGTINHSLLTAESIVRSGCVLRAIVLSCLPSDDLEFAHSNRQIIADRVSCSVLLSTDLSSLV